MTLSKKHVPLIGLLRLRLGLLLRNENYLAAWAIEARRLVDSQLRLLLNRHLIRIYRHIKLIINEVISFAGDSFL